MPMPSALLVKNGSKTSFNLSSGMPEPRSDTDSWANFSTREVRMLMLRFSFRRVLHRVDPVHHKVQNDLLKLDVIAEDRKRDPVRSDEPIRTFVQRQEKKKIERFANNVI